MFPFNFFKQSSFSLGIDLGTSAIKLVELEKKENRLHLKTYGIFPLGQHLEYLTEETYVKVLKIPDKELAGMIKKLLKEAQVVSREANFSIPVYSSFSITINLPIMPVTELESAVPLEAKKYIPVPIDDVVLDWSIIDRDEKNKQYEILLVAVPKEIINRYHRIAGLAGLKVKSLEMESFSLVRAIVGNDKSPILLVDSGARSTNISIVDGGFIRLTQNLEIAGVEITQTIAERLKIDIREAERIKKDKEAIRKHNLEPVIQPVLDSMILKINQIIRRYQAKSNRRIEKCILVGGAIELINWQERFANKLNLDISVGNPFARVVYPEIINPILKEIAPALAVAVGLAMRQ